MFKVFLYKPNNGRGWMGKKVFKNEDAAAKVLAEAMDNFNSKLKEVSEDWLLWECGSWMLKVELAA